MILFTGAAPLVLSFLLLVATATTTTTFLPFPFFFLFATATTTTATTRLRLLGIIGYPAAMRVQCVENNVVIGHDAFPVSCM